MNHSTPGIPVHHQLPEITQTHVHRIGDPIQPSHPLSSPSLPSPNPPSIRVFSNESTLCIRWPKYWSFSFSISPSSEHPGLITFRMDFQLLLNAWFLEISLFCKFSEASEKGLVILCPVFLDVWSWKSSGWKWKNLLLLIKSMVQVTKSQRTDSCYGAHLLHSRGCYSSMSLCGTYLCQALLRTWNTEMKKANRFSELKERILMGRHTTNKERDKKTLIFKYLFIVTCLFLWLCRVLAVAHRIFNLHCGIQDL